MALELVFVATEILALDLELLVGARCLSPTHGYVISWYVMKVLPKSRVDENPTHDYY